MTLLDIGCGWGALAWRAPSKYDVNVIGLTLSGEQRNTPSKSSPRFPPTATSRSGCRAGKNSTTRSTGIVSIGAFEHFDLERYPAFFETAYNALPDDGTMLLHNITGFRPAAGQKLGLHMTFEDARLRPVHHDRDLSRWPAAVGDDGAGEATEAGFKLTQLQEIARTTFRTPQDLGRRARGHGRRGHRDPGPGGLRPLRQVPQRLPEILRLGPHQRASVHAAEVARSAEEHLPKSAGSRQPSFVG